MLIRPPLRPFIAMPNPVPSPSAPPSIASAGTRTPSRITCAVGWAFQPIFCFVGAETQSRRVLFDEERRNPARALGAGAGHDHVDVGGARAGDELLDAVEHIIRSRLAPPWCAARRRRNLRPARSGSSSRWPPSTPVAAPRPCAVRRCRSVSIIQAHMLWIDRNAAVGGSAAASCSKIRTASSRRRPLPPTSSRAVDRRHAQLGGLAQHVDGEVLVGDPTPGHAARGAFRRTRPPSRRSRARRRRGREHRRRYFMVGMTNSAPSLMPDGQRWVTVLTLV